MSTNNAPRLFLDALLAGGASVSASPDQAHYLQHVMRMGIGGGLRIFNGRDGEWAATIASLGKKGVEIRVGELLKPQTAEPDLWLCCAPIKKTHFDFMIEKATELGVSAIQPVLTQRTQIREVNTDRVRLLAAEAAEQSERVSVPEIRKPLLLAKLISSWEKHRTLIVCAEWGDALPVKEALLSIQQSPAAVIVGPEGGFDAEELAQLHQIEKNIFVRLGPRILRADTAAIAALTCWQAMCGDWKTATKKSG